MKLAYIDIRQNFFGPSASKFWTINGVSALASFLIKSILVVAGIILLFYIILGGIGIISSAGKDDPKSLEQARQTVTTGVIGFLVVFLAYWIVKLILNLLHLPNIL